MKIKSAVLLAILLSSGISFGEDTPDPVAPTDEDIAAVEDMVTNMGLSDNDNRGIIEHVIYEGNPATYESLNDSGLVSDEALEQIKDDARTD